MREGRSLLYSRFGRSRSSRRSRQLASRSKTLVCIVVGGYCPEERRCGLCVLILAISALQVTLLQVKPRSAVYISSRNTKNPVHAKVTLG